MKPTEIKQILFELGGQANKHLGQHFLIDEKALEEIIKAAEIKSGDRVLEIGPGLGVLTKQLVESGAQVIAIEKDKRFVPIIENVLKNSKLNNQVILTDAAKNNWSPLLENKSWKFVSNLPYAITSLALRKALYETDPAPEVLVVLVQKEVAERIVAPARGGKMSLLALMVALASIDVKIIRRVPPGAFFPPPKVDSAILKIIPASHVARQNKWGIDSEKVMAVAKKGFAHPRKLLFRNLALDEKKWIELAQKLLINIKARSEDLSVKQWAELAKLLLLNSD